MWQSEKSLLLEEKVSAVRLTDEVRAGSIKLVIAHASGGILFCAHRKVRKRSVKGERAFYKAVLSPLNPPILLRPVHVLSYQFLHRFQLVNTVPIDLTSLPFHSCLHREWRSAFC